MYTQAKQVFAQTLASAIRPTACRSSVSNSVSPSSRDRRSPAWTLPQTDDKRGSRLLGGAGAATVMPTSGSE